MGKNHVYGLIGVAVGSFLVYLLHRRIGQKHDDAYQGGIITDAAEWMANNHGENIPEITKALRELISGQQANPILDKLLRIDCELTKEGPDKIKRTVAVAVQNDGKVTVGKVTRDLAWDELPSSVREAFMREQTKTQTYVVVERQQDRNKE